MVQAAGRRALHASPGTILVVEDEALIRMMVVEELRESGFRVLEAASAAEAIARIAARRTRRTVTPVLERSGRSGSIASRAC